jgi:hypothetical protein
MRRPARGAEGDWTPDLPMDDFRFSSTRQTTDDPPRFGDRGRGPPPQRCRKACRVKACSQASSRQPSDSVRPSHVRTHTRLASAHHPSRRERCDQMRRRTVRPLTVDWDHLTPGDLTRRLLARPSPPACRLGRSGARLGPPPHCPGAWRSSCVPASPTCYDSSRDPACSPTDSTWGWAPSRGFSTSPCSWPPGEGSSRPMTSA